MMTGSINIEKSEDFGRQVKFLRTKLRRLTLAQLAARCGIHASTLSELENGKHHPSLPTMIAVVTGLECRLLLAAGEGGKDEHTD